MSRKEGMLGLPHYDNHAQRVNAQHDIQKRSDERGKVNFLRAISLLNLLVGEGELIKVSRATPKQDRKGVDLFCHIDVGSERVKIPVQVKSSLNRAREFRHRYKKDIVVLVVNETRSDQNIRRQLRLEVKDYLLKRGLQPR